MTEFLTALGLFLAAHLVPAYPPMRRRLVGALGEKRYLMLYSAISLILLAWVIIALLRAPYVHLFTPPFTAHRVAVVLMPAAFVFVMAGLWEPNPLSVSLSTRSFDPDKPGIVAVTRHPVLWGFGVWAGTHAAVNGALAPFILFGGMTVLSFAGMVMVDRKRRKQMGTEAWHRLAEKTSAVPLAALIRGRSGTALTRRTLVGTAVGLALYLLFLFWAHAVLFGREPLAMVSP